MLHQRALPHIRLLKKVGDLLDTADEKTTEANLDTLTRPHPAPERNDALARSARGTWEMPSAATPTRPCEQARETYAVSNIVSKTRDEFSLYMRVVDKIDCAPGYTRYRYHAAILAC